MISRVLCKTENLEEWEQEVHEPQNEVLMSMHTKILPLKKIMQKATRTEDSLW